MRAGGNDRAWRTQHFLGPPYRIDELEPGTYLVVTGGTINWGVEVGDPARMVISTP